MQIRAGWKAHSKTSSRVHARRVDVNIKCWVFRSSLSWTTLIMQRALFEGRFYQTYYFANAITNVLRNQFEYLRDLNDFYGDDKYLALVRPFSKYSALHCFIEFVIDAIISDEINDIKLDIRQDQASSKENFIGDFGELHSSILPINEALTYYGIKHITFQDWLKEHGKDFQEARDDDVSDYYIDLRLEGELDSLLEKAVQEVFFVIFQNRQLLLLFNEMMASQVAEVQLSDVSDIDKEYQEYFASPGILKRVNIPKWVKRAVYYRDRGLCTICHCDLSGELNISNREHYDHIVPLAKGGLNDVSNIQLLCQDCNLKKRGVEITTSDFYENWYSMTE